MEQPSTTERCRLLLNAWRAGLSLSSREQSRLDAECQQVDQQLTRLKDRHLRIAVAGRVGVGKSSLINALVGRSVMTTDVLHGSTRHQQGVLWPVQIQGLDRVELIDTPGLDEIDGSDHARLALNVAHKVDLVLFVLDGDLTRSEQQALSRLLDEGQTVQLVLNRCDRWPRSELSSLIRSVRRRLPDRFRHLPLCPVAAAPREAQLSADNTVSSAVQSPRVDALHQHLVNQLQSSGELLLALNTLRKADGFERSRQQLRLQQHRQTAQGLIGRYAAAKATGVAVNPILAIDLAGGMACDTALVMQLCRLYNLPMQRAGARQLLAQLTGQNALLGGVQLGLAALKQLLLLAAPLSAGLSLAPAAPIAVAQAALAVHATKRTGSLVATELLNGLQRQGGQPGALLRRLAQQDPVVDHWLAMHPRRQETDLQLLLP